MRLMKTTIGFKEERLVRGSPIVIFDITRESHADYGQASSSFAAAWKDDELVVLARVYES